MKRRLTILAFSALAVIVLYSIVLTVTSPAHAGGAEQISGVGYFPDDEDNASGYCDPPTAPTFPGDPSKVLAILTLDMNGDLNGCLYSYVLTAKCSPSGAYNETGIDIFVDAVGNGANTFQTTYRFTAKFTECDLETDTPGGSEIFGRCQHPITPGLGEGIYEGVTGRFDIKDNVETGEFFYKGHLKGL